MYKPKNIVVCLDGTGNQIEENISNVLKLYRTLDKDGTKDQKQVTFYDQGVGTIGRQYTWGVISQTFKTVLGLATGLGLDTNVLRAYEFISRNYHEEEHEDENGKKITVRDRIYIFGFSRGAHTARVLAAFIYNMGLIKPQQLHLAGAAFSAYKRFTDKTGPEEIIHFNKITQPFRPATEFLGVWDTVSSMIVPRRQKFFIPSIEKLRNTRKNPGVKTFRHAMSIDERRYMFRLDAWVEPQEFKPNYYASEKVDDQDSLQVWFAGHHSDVGGGHKRMDSGISQFPLCWMLKQAMEKGLIVNTRMVDYVAQGIPFSSTTQYHYPKPEANASIHDSVRRGWRPFEYFPKLTKYREWEGKGKRWSFFGIYFPMKEPRPIPENALVHQSVIDRMADKDTDYAPVNLPSHYTVQPHDGRRAKDWLK